MSRRADIEARIRANPYVRISQTIGGPKELDLPTPMPKPKKYRNKPCEYEGQRFDSKLELKVYLDLVAVWGAPNVIRQVSIPIGKGRMRPDFFVITSRFDDGSFRGHFVDAKGVITAAWRRGANHLEDKHGIKISLVKK